MVKVKIDAAAPANLLQADVKEIEAALLHVAYRSGVMGPKLPLLTGVRKNLRRNNACESDLLLWFALWDSLLVLSQRSFV